MVEGPQEEPVYARHTLQEEAEKIIRDAFEQAPLPRPRVVWWDDGGHLEDVIEEACASIGIDLVKAENSPLELRKKAPQQDDDPAVWYIPEAKNGRRWFRDIEAMNAERQVSVEELAARVYGVNIWDIADPDRLDESKRASLANILTEELTKSRRPTLRDLKSELLTEGHGSPLELLLRDGWTIEEDPATVDQVREQLEEEGLPVLSSSDDAAAITEKVRRWATAQMLIANGADSSIFPDGYDKTGGRGDAQRILARILEDGGSLAVAEKYLDTAFWPDVIEGVDDPWSLATCPVDGGLEERLWRTWLDDWDDDQYEACLQHARLRADALEEAYGDGNVREANPWVRAWRQAEALAELGDRLATWDEGLEDVSVARRYADREDGTWHIDRAVREIVLSGDPEESLPSDHPASNELPDLRAELVGPEGYIGYLQELGRETATQLDRGDLFEDIPQTPRFWSEHDEDLATGQKVIIFYIDALRLDLARDLADKLREEEETFQVKEELWAGVLPSETEYGMGSLTPGNVHTFEIDMRDGTLRAQRNRRTLDLNFREQLLEDEGWSIAKDEDDGWEPPRVAYFDQEIDKVGENELDKIEEKLADRVDDLADFIVDIMSKKGDWPKAFIVTDHGFLLLPEGTNQRRVAAPESASDKRRRFYAPAGGDDPPGTLTVGKMTPDIGYLGDPIQVLTDPLALVSKKGQADSRYVHGGALPQEFVLNFLEIDRT